MPLQKTINLHTLSSVPARQRQDHTLQPADYYQARLTSQKISANNISYYSHHLHTVLYARYIGGVSIYQY